MGANFSADLSIQNQKMIQKATNNAINEIKSDTNAESKVKSVQKVTKFGIKINLKSAQKVIQKRASIFDHCLDHFGTPQMEPNLTNVPTNNSN